METETNSEIGWRKYMEKKLAEKKLCEEEVILNRVFDRYVKRYQKENESVVYELGISLMLTMNFLMTAYLVVTVINN
jgi:hypothetical protein